MRRRRARGARIVLLAALLASLAGCGRDRPNVVVIVVDTLRADRVGVLGGTPGLTPFLDRLGRSGVVFPNAYSTSSWTNPSVASLFTSRYPSQTRVATFESRLSEREETIAKRLHGEGWRGIGMVANFRLTRDLGFAQGFDVWFSRLMPRGRKMSTQQLAQDTIRYWDRHVGRFFWRRWQPLLLYLHAMEPHAPYDPPAAARRKLAIQPPPGVNEAEAMAKVISIRDWKLLRPDEVAYLAALYDAEVAAFDERLRRLWKRLEARGLLRGAIVVVTADHGEEFGEHGGYQHGRALYSESVRIPLIIAGPGLPAGRIVQDEVSLVDVAPTLLDLLGLPPEPRYEGRSLLPLVGAPAAHRDVLLELEPLGLPYDPRVHAAGLVHDGDALLVSPAGVGQTFALGVDPGEQRPNPPALADEAGALRTRLDDWRARLGARAGAAETAPVDPTMRERLRALGYAN